ncbi:MAG: DinB family protein [bacterium]
MAKIVHWGDRNFDHPYPVDFFPELLVRLRGTPVRGDEITRGISPSELLTRKPAERKWSAQEHLGHLADLEYLWHARIQDYLNGAESLTPGDPSNKKTNTANHNASPLREIIAQFRNYRRQTTQLLDRLAPSDWDRVATHPQYGPIRLADMFYRVAEHDDHHLATIYNLVHPAHTGV